MPVTVQQAQEAGGRHDARTPRTLNNLLIDSSGAVDTVLAHNSARIEATVARMLEVAGLSVVNRIASISVLNIPLVRLTTEM